MRTMLFALLLTAVYLAGHTTSKGQPENPSRGNVENPAPEPFEIAVLARAFNDSVVVRWVPKTPSAFRAGIRDGYLLTRRSIDDNGTSVIDFQILVKPWTIALWLKNVSASDTLASACAQLVNGKNTPLSSDEVLTLDKIMQQQNQNDMRMAMAMILADVKPVYAQGMALGYVDKTVTPGRKYSYSLLPMADPRKFRAEVATTFLVNRKEPSPEQMPPVAATPGDRAIQLSWDRQIGEAYFSGYFFERSDDGGKRYRRLNRIPWFQPGEGPGTEAIVYGDSVKANYKTYHYRVSGITPFGELVASAPVPGMATDQTPPPPVNEMKAVYDGSKAVRITWAYDKNPADFAGFIVGRSLTLDGPFTPVHKNVLGRQSRELTDPVPEPAVSCYYKIVTVDTAGNVSPGLPVSCLIQTAQRPSRPKNLQGYIDSTGFVRIVWDANPEPDIYGYKVLYANSPDHVFIDKTPDYLAIPGFNDSTTLRTTTRELYFKVLAYNRGFQVSEPSDILTLKRPDLLPPSPPVISDYLVSDSAVTFRWNLSSAGDVKEQLLLRRGRYTERWQTIARLGRDIDRYTDKTIKGESDYGYALVAIDSSGLQSDQSFPLSIRTPRLAVRPVSGLKATVNADNSVSLSWGYDVPNCRFTVFRSDGEEKFRSVDAVYDKREYKDTRPGKGRRRYAVRTMLQDGRTSSFSAVVHVDVQAE